MNNIRTLLPLLLVVTPLVACAATPTIYEAKPFEGWAVDAETGQPVEGAAVLARWEMDSGGPETPGETHSPKVVETETDSKGHFVIQGWGPEPVCCGFMDGNDPEVVIFKPGYEGQSESDSLSAVVDDPHVRKSYWTGKTFKMVPYKGGYKGKPGQEDFEVFEGFASNFGFLKDSPCEWSNFPIFLGALSRQVQLFREHGYNDYLSIVSDLITHDEGYSKIYHCVSPKEFFKGLGK